MAEGVPVKRRLGGFGAGLALIGAWAIVLLGSIRVVWRDGSGTAVVPRELLYWLLSVVDNAILRIFSGFPWLEELVHRLFESLEASFGVTYAATLAVATLAVPVAFLARMIARARLRAGHADPLDRLRRWASRRTVAAALVSAFPILCQALFFETVWLPDWSRGYRVIAFLAAGLAQLAVVRGAWRALLAPTVPTDGDVPIDIAPDEIRFAAVAVTRETRAAVGALAAITLGVIAWMLSLPTLALFKDPRVFAVIAGYVALAAAGALLFRGASKISVGVDGIYVGGTSRARFFAYRDLDEARVEGGDVELVRRGRVVLRLQLHGEDATRRDAILARIHEALARVKDVERDAAANFVTSRATEKVAQSARGGGDYRMPSVSRDALWALVEGAAVDAVTRTAAAEALLGTGAAPERERLRVAAAHCADPHVRVALEELADDADQAAEAAPARRVLAVPPLDA